MLSETTRIIPASVMSEIDKKAIYNFGIPGEVLMENAGRTASRILLEKINISKKNIIILCGPGNNGGDGFVMARYLYSRCRCLKIILLVENKKLSGDALLNYKRALKLNICIIECISDKIDDKIKKELTESDIIIDSIFGTGLRAAPEGRFAEIISFTESLNKFVMAVDIPSGILGDTGEIPGHTLSCDICATFGFPKPAHYLSPGKEKRGELFVCDIGIPLSVSKSFSENIHILSKNYIKSIFPERKKNSHKGDFGHLGIIGGSRQKPGAALMASLAAHRAGAGLVTLCMPESVEQQTLPETMKFYMSSEKGVFSENGINQLDSFIKNKTAVVIGPGMGTSRGCKKILEALLKKSEIPLVIDADGLNILAQNKELLLLLNGNIILTPHPKEMAGLSGKSIKDIMSDQIGAAKDFALKYNCNLILKTSTSVIASPDADIRINTTGNSGLSTGGSGDILAGITGSFLAQKMSPSHAAHASVFIHGMSGDELSLSKGPFGFLPTETAENLPFIFKSLGL